MPAVLLAAGVLFSVIYCWPIPQPPAAEDGVGAEIAAAGEPPSGEGTEGPPGGELESGEEIEMETIDEAGRKDTQYLRGPYMTNLTTELMEIAYF